MTIPDAHLILNSVGGIPDDPNGIPATVGAITDTTGWSLGGATPYLFDMYENGSPMTDGRVFQCTSLVPPLNGFPGGYIAIQQIGPTELIPISGHFGGSYWYNSNFPFIFLHATTDASALQTCFYNDGIDALFFNGAFYCGSPVPGAPLLTQATTQGATPIGTIPLIIDSADAVGPLSGYDSSLFSWCLAGDNNQGSVVPVRNSRPIADIGISVTAVDSRPAIMRYHSGGLVLGGIAGGAMANPTSGDFYSKGLGVSRGLFQDQRCYRRAATHATYDWPGYMD